MKKFISGAFVLFLLAFTVGICQADYLFIPHRAFNGSNYDSTYTSLNNLTRMQSQGYIVAPVYLPQGAVIDGIFLFFEDKGPGSLECEMVRENPDTGLTNYQFPIFTSSSTSGIKHDASWRVTSGTRIINHAIFTYYLRIKFSFTDNFTNYALYGVRIHYH